MKKTLSTAVVSVGALLMLTGCITINPSSESPAPPTKAVQTVVPKDTALEAFDTLAAENDTAASGTSMMKLGEAICSALDRGVSFHNVLTTGLEQDSSDPVLYGKIIGTSVHVLCPEYTREMEDFVREASA